MKERRVEERHRLAPEMFTTERQHLSLTRVDIVILLWQLHGGRARRKRRHRHHHR